jgi:hypothetical protein
VDATVIRYARAIMHNRPSRRKPSDSFFDGWQERLATVCSLSRLPLWLADVVSRFLASVPVPVGPRLEVNKK